MPVPGGPGRGQAPRDEQSAVIGRRKGLVSHVPSRPHFMEQADRTGPAATGAFCDKPRQTRNWKFPERPASHRPATRRRAAGRTGSAGIVPRPADGTRPYRYRVRPAPEGRRREPRRAISCRISSKLRFGEPSAPPKAPEGSTANALLKRNSLHFCKIFSLSNDILDFHVI